MVTLSSRDLSKSSKRAISIACTPSLSDTQTRFPSTLGMHSDLFLFNGGLSSSSAEEFSSGDDSMEDASSDDISSEDFSLEDSSSKESSSGDGETFSAGNCISS